MDAAARRELWNTIADAKPGRTFLLTTHYMDEADILGDAIAIMARGVVKCVGSSLFLKKRFGGGFRLCCERAAGARPAALAAFDTFLFEHMGFNGKRERTGAEARLAERQIVATLDAGAADRLPALFRALDDGARGAEDRVGEGGDDDDDVVEADPHDAAAGPAPAAAKPPARPPLEWGALETDDRRQALALWRKQLTIVARDPYEVVVAAVPTYAAIVAFALDSMGAFGDDRKGRDICVMLVCACGWLLYPAAGCARLVRERQLKLRALLNVAGCGRRAYWTGNFVGDYVLCSVNVVGTWVVVAALGEPRWFTGGRVFYMLPAWAALNVALAYSASTFFDTPSAVYVGVPLGQFLSLIVPQIIILFLFVTIFKHFGMSFESVQSKQSWLGVLVSPIAAFTVGFYELAHDTWPAGGPTPCGVIVAIMAATAVLHFSYAASSDARAYRGLAPTPHPRPASDDDDGDVAAERRAVAAARGSTPPPPLAVDRLRVVYPGRGDAADVVAVDDLSFQVARGEVFGLLGANGAGKTSTIDVLVRHAAPAAGDARIRGVSVLADFEAASKGLGFVAQDNTLWPTLTCRDHLRLFARLRGAADGAAFEAKIDYTLDRLDLRRHKSKQAHALSGGAKRKVCVAVALVGDPACVLLDEPSAGLDPVARRKLWNVVAETAGSRAVVLTTHLMDECEALCDRLAILVRGSSAASHVAAPQDGSAATSTSRRRSRARAGGRRRLRDVLGAAAPTPSWAARATTRCPGALAPPGGAAAAQPRLKIDEAAFTQPTLESVVLDVAERYDTPADEGAVV
ncbi:ATPase [Aureococcus anophagefferens]|nr:ATPase [Aureococcus anophagefferens]